jgi:enoyl-CoA hydratase/carnithine racemase
MTNSRDNEVTITRQDGYVTVVTLNRPPHNYVDAVLMRQLADTMHALDKDDACRAIVLAAEGKNFCAGADFNTSGDEPDGVDPTPIYAQAMRLFRTTKPVVAAVQGGAIGAGLGLALTADFRVGCDESRFSASFTRLGFHPGFGLSVTLPRLIGEQKAALLFYTGRRITGAQALELGLIDELAPLAQVHERAVALAQEIAGAAPIALASTRATLRGDLAGRVTAANQHELARQKIEFATTDFKEGVAAMAARRAPAFTGR